MDSFMNEFEEFACNRMSIAIQKARRSPEYIKHREEKDRLDEDIKAKMGHVFFRANEDVEGSICEITELAYYKQGFKDGMALVREFGGVK